MFASIAFPVIDPVAIAIGPIAIRWYALAYIAGLVLGWRYCVILCRRDPKMLDPDLFDDLLMYATLGVVLGGRLGYVIFYNPLYFLENPLEALMIWRGGMSFHGGFLGVVLAIAYFARKHAVPALVIGDIVATATPVGLFFGRIANFINAELYGRVTDVPWGVVFPNGGPLPRHPSQLYEAGLEGIVLLLVLSWFALRTRVRYRPGVLVGAFFIGYGIARSVVELVRQPDAHIGFLAGGLTMGQILSAPMIIAGIALIVWARRRPEITPPKEPAGSA